jgi:C4-dicarboxylate transporter DctM subunit
MPGVMLTSVALLLAIGAPVFAALLAPVLGWFAFASPTPPMLVAQRVFSGLDRFPLMAIPFFILAGNIMATGGLSRRLIRLARALVGPLTGGLAITAVSGSMFFAAVSGSSPATVVAVGRIMLPAMRAEGYGRGFATGLLMGSGSLGILIPPSIFMIVYGAVTGASIGALFLAGVGAGLVYGVAFIAVSVVYARLAGAPRGPAWDAREIAAAFRESAWGVAIPFLILGGIYGGFFTPTEASAVAVAYAAAVTLLIHREMTLRGFVDTLIESAVTTAQVMIIVAAASAFAWWLTTSGVGRGVGALLAAAGDDPLTLLLVVNVIVILAGMVMDPNSIIIILVPLIAPAALAAGVDPIHLGVVLAVNAAIGMFSPPFGLNLFVASGLGVGYREAMVGATPFIAVGLVALSVVTLWPGLSLTLPALVYPDLFAARP